MIYIKSNEHNLTNNYNDKVRMIVRSRLKGNIKYVVTTLYSAIKMGFLDKIDNGRKFCFQTNVRSNSLEPT